METLVADHPLIAHKLTMLRDVNTETPVFRSLTDELVTLLAYEATRDIKVEHVTVRTPVAEANGVRLARPKPLVVPVFDPLDEPAELLLPELPQAAANTVTIASGAPTRTVHQNFRLDSMRFMIILLPTPTKAC